jgi:hypothetical protein
MSYNIKPGDLVSVKKDGFWSDWATSIYAEPMCDHKSPMKKLGEDDVFIVIGEVSSAAHTLTKFFVVGHIMGYVYALSMKKL